MLREFLVWFFFSPLHIVHCIGMMALMLAVPEPLWGLGDHEKTIMVVRNGENARGPSIVRCPWTAGLPNKDFVTLVDGDGNEFVGQIAVDRLNSVAKQPRPEIILVLPEMKANQVIELHVSEQNAVIGDQFKWHDDGSTQAELRIGDTSLLRYMYEELDDSTDERRQETFKPYHHVFSPNGKVLLTKGPGGLFPHHRGIFFGYNRISYGDLTADTWHCKNGESQIHQGHLSRTTGPIFGRDCNLILWNGKQGKPFAQERRQTTTYKIGTGTLIEFESRLEALAEKIVLKGDPQHAGVQFRASQKVPDRTRERTFYVRPDGKDQPGRFRNWSAQNNESEMNRNHVNLPWNAVCFVIDDQPYSVCYLDHPANPKPARFSERDYGRFGSYFEYELTPDKPLVTKYRFWIQDGEIESKTAESLSFDFVDPLSCEMVGQ